MPSALKAWLDQVIIVGRTAGETRHGRREAGHRRRRPRRRLRAGHAARELRVPDRRTWRRCYPECSALDVDFIIPELTLARSNPAMASLVDAADASRAQAHEDAVVKAKALASRFAA